MFAPDDTIVAIATPPGKGGLGVVRISGPCSRPIAAKMLEKRTPLQPRQATFTRVRGVDEVVATLFEAPHSFTGQDVVEISAHGSPLVQRIIVEAAIAAGARLAQPGEFTLRAFLNGRLDLVQAEAIADLIDAATPLQARTAFDQLEGTLTRRIVLIEESLFDLMARLEASLDFPDEGYHFIRANELAGTIEETRTQIDELLRDARRGRMIREGALLVITGRTNVGKSTIFNNLAGQSRAIVTNIPGTTRDMLTERIDLEGIPVTLVDTAGLRDTADVVEREGVDRARRAVSAANLVLVILDHSEPLRDEDEAVLAETSSRRRIVVRNKSDRPSAWAARIDGTCFQVSALTGVGMTRLRSGIVAALTGEEALRDSAAISNVRHIDLLHRARASLARATDGLSRDATLPEEFILSDLQQARAALEEITGKRTTDDLLAHIFERFCVGK